MNTRGGVPCPLPCRKYPGHVIPLETRERTGYTGSGISPTYLEKELEEMKPRKIYRQDWRTAAQCVGQDPAAWDVETWPRMPKGERPAAHAARAAALCTGCPVLAECAADALEPLALATVRAGVAIPPNPTGDPRRRVLARLQDIARGVHSCVARA